MDKNSSCCCAGSGDCCSPKLEKKKITIDFLYLDLSVCERCQGTENNLDDAINDVSGVLKAADFDVEVNKVNITSKELAIKYEFISSPTIRINGKDIQLDVKESSCKECGDLCGDNVDCRVWEYNSVEYTEPPKALIVYAILKEIYNPNPLEENKLKADYKLPENLEIFFDGTNKKQSILEE